MVLEVQMAKLLFFSIISPGNLKNCGSDKKVLEKKVRFLRLHKVLGSKKFFFSKNMKSMICGWWDLTKQWPSKTIEQTHCALMCIHPAKDEVDHMIVRYCKLFFRWWDLTDLLFPRGCVLWLRLCAPQLSEPETHPVWAMFQVEIF